MKAFKSSFVLRPLLAIIFLSNTAAVFAQETTPTTKDAASDGQTKIEKMQVAVDLPKTGGKRGEERYRIGLQDVLEVTVYRHPELSQPNIRMDETGRIRLPRIDVPILAICKTENDLSAEIVNLYKENYLRDPYVTVFVKEQNSQPLSVIGAVEKPGNFYTNRRLTLLELLSFAGGQDVEKAGSKIQVARVGGISGCNLDSNAQGNAVAEPDVAEPDAVTFFSYNLDEVLKGKVNPVMRPGDIVVVLEAEQAYVTGNVYKPQSVSLKQTVTLTQAIAAAGGTLPSTKKSQVRLVRQSSGGAAKQELLFDLKAIKDKTTPDPILQANDIVEVPTDKVKDFTNSLVKALTGGASNIFYRIP